MGSQLPVMLVDGYNVIGAWKELSVIRDTDSLDRARNALTEKMINYSAVERYDATLVFDAYNQGNLAVTETVSPFLKLHYTEQGQTADAYIEKRCREYARDPLRHRRRLVVVTSDRVQGLLAGGFGAELRSASAFVSDVQAVLAKLKGQTQSERGGRIGGTLDRCSKIKPSDRQRLQRMRLGLDT
jgi:predicted RNA-binding protein with PIN domain